MAEPNRTPSGGPSEAIRQKTEIDNSGRFPIFDQQSAESALRLRGKGKPQLTKAQRRSLIRRAAKYAPDMAKAAFMEDKKNGDI